MKLKFFFYIYFSSPTKTKDILKNLAFGKEIYFSVKNMHVFRTRFNCIFFGSQTDYDEDR